MQPQPPLRPCRSTIKFGLATVYTEQRVGQAVFAYWNLDSTPEQRIRIKKPRQDQGVSTACCTTAEPWPAPVVGLDFLLQAVELSLLGTVVPLELLERGVVMAVPLLRLCLGTATYMHAVS